MFEEYAKHKELLCSYVNNWIAVAKEMKEEKLAEELGGQLNELRKLRFNIAVVGNQKRGKSTLINTLLRRKDDKLSPIDVKVCTGGVVHYMNKDCDEEKRDRECADVYFKDGRVEKGRSIDEIGMYIREENNENNKKGLSRVEVYAECPGLHACCLVDTPGADAIVQHHHETAFQFFPHADAIIMTILASQPLSDADQEILKALDTQGRKIFYVVTKIDKQREGDWEEIRRWVSDMIVKSGLSRPDKIYLIACKPVFKAMKEGDEKKADEMRKRWHVDELVKDLEDHIIESKSLEGRNIRDTLLDLLARLKTALDAKKKINEEFISLQDVDVERIKADCARANKEFESFHTRVKKKIGEFEDKWDKHARRIVNGLDSFSLVLKDKMVTHIEKGGLFASIKNLFSISQTLKQVMQEPITEYLERNGDELQKLIQDLGDNIHEDVTLYKAHISELNILGPLGGLTVVGTAGYAVSVSGVTAAVSGAIETGITVMGGITSLSILTIPTVLSDIGVFVTAVTGAIVPLAIALLAVGLTGPAAKVIWKYFAPKKVDEALRETKDTIKEELEIYKARIVDKINQQIEDADAKRRAVLNECEAKLADISPEVKEEKKRENQHIAELIRGREPEEEFLRSHFCSANS